MSTTDHTMFAFAEMETGRNFINLTVADQETQKRYPFRLLFSPVPDLPEGVYQPLGYGRSYVDRPDGKVRIVLSVRGKDGHMDYELLASPEETKQLERELRKRFKAQRNRALLADSTERHLTK